MLTHFIKTINWVDVALVFLLVRVIFIGVKNGFIAEVFKFGGIVAAVFVSLHYYAFLAAWLAGKTAMPISAWELIMFMALWFLMVLAAKLLRDGILILFKVETNHQGFDKYAAGILAVGRGILVCSLTICAVILMRYGPLTRMTLHSFSYKIEGKAAVNVYGLLYNNLVAKLAPGQHYNEAVGALVRGQLK